ncbi:MAG: hypothetical protein IJQ31_08000 [Thermoguttaceae bacterium]|nr:hypothetical protein [Thermoguttaceae bacterium]
MNNDQNNRQTLLEKLRNNGCFREPEDVLDASVFGDSYFNTMEDLELLSTLPQLNTLKIVDLPETVKAEELIHVLEKFPALKALKLACFKIEPRFMKGILGLKNIQELSFKEVRYDESTLVYLCWQDHLKRLTFNKVSLFPKIFLGILDTLPQLESLDLSDSYDKMDILSFAEEHLPNLKNLIWKPSHLSGDIIEKMISMEMESLWVPLAGLDKEYRNLDFLNRFKSLKTLYLVGLNPMCIFIRRPKPLIVDWKIPNLNNLFLVDLPQVELVDFSGMPHLKSFICSCQMDCDNSIVEFRNLDSLKELEEFDINTKRSLYPIVKDLENSPNLRTLCAKATDFLKPEDVPHLEGLKNLEGVSFGIDEQVTAQDFEQLSVFPKLNGLDIRNSKDNGVVGAIEKKCPNLRFLSAEGKVTDEDVQLFVSKSPMFGILIKDCSNLSPESIEAIFTRKELTYIYLSGAPNEKLEIRDFPNLKYLELRNMKNLMEVEFANLPMLECLPLDCPVLESLKMLDLLALDNLQMDGCPLLYLVWFRNLPKLSCLNVQGSHDLDLSALVWLSALKSLSMDYEQFQQDYVLETLQEIPNLKHLRIGGFVDKMEQKIRDLPFEPENNDQEDEDSEVDWKKKFIDAEKKKIQDALPGCRIEFE